MLLFGLVQMRKIGQSSCACEEKCNKWTNVIKADIVYFWILSKS